MTTDFFHQGSHLQALAAAAELGIEIDTRALKRNDAGSDFVVFECTALDGTPWIFRIPRRPELVKTLDTEQRLLELVSRSIEFEVPRWHRASAGVVAYIRLEGVPAAAEDPQTGVLDWSIDPADPPQSYIDTLGLLMAAVHGIDLSDVRETGLREQSNQNARAQFAERLARGQRELVMHPSWTARAARWLDTDAWWPADSRLLHGDLHPGHTLIEDSGSIVAVLDWSDAQIGDPCLEFIECSRKFSPPTLERIFDAYHVAGGALSTEQRSAVQEGVAFAPLTLGLLGIDTGQRRYVDRANAALRQPAYG